jgi:hypothetical protein
MAQHDYNIANSDGATVRADINAALEAVASLNSGATAPSTTFAHMRWADTATGLLKQRNAANNAWIVKGTLTDVITALASQAEAEAGTATDRLMTPERTAQAIAALTTSVSQATQSAIEAETDENTYVPPDLVRHSPGVAKAHGFVDRDGGTPSLVGTSYNISGVTDDGAAQTIVTLDTDMSGAIYAAGAQAIGTNARFANVHTLATGSFKVKTVNESIGDQDTQDFACWAFGDQA